MAIQQHLSAEIEVVASVLRDPRSGGKDDGESTRSKTRAFDATTQAMAEEDELTGAKEQGHDEISRSEVHGSRSKPLPRSDVTMVADSCTRRIGHLHELDHSAGSGEREEEVGRSLWSSGRIFWVVGVSDVSEDGHSHNLALPPSTTTDLHRPSSWQMASETRACGGSGWLTRCEQLSDDRFDKHTTMLGDGVGRHGLGRYRDDLGVAERHNNGTCKGGHQDRSRRRSLRRSPSRESRAESRGGEGRGAVTRPAASCWMDDVYGRIEVFPQHFLPSQQSMETPADGLSTSKTNLDSPPSSRRRSWTPKRVMGAASLLHLLSLPRIRWSSSTEDDDKIELTRAEVESLRTEIADAEERESQLKARLENIDEVLRYARLSGYLYIRSRWTQLPGEPPILDDADVDDWLPRFVVLQGQCVYYYLKSTDLSPQESTLLCDIVEVGQLPNFVPEDEKTRYAFYIMTSQGLKFECSSMSEIQVDSWVRAIRGDCGLSDGAESRSKTSRQEVGSWF
uniref:PH domain-containing protein n=1 Tax=Oryza meridionalis TaxID=40149 RepID=A0A0E0DVA2_9ORYZ